MSNPVTDSKKTAVPQTNTEPKHEESQLRGTFASVMIVGGCIALMWILVFALFLVRN